MTLSTATVEDEESIRELIFSVLREFGLEPSPHDTDKDLYSIREAYKGGAFHVLRDDAGRIIGTVAVMRMSDERCELRKMYLHSAHRGKGLGRKLMDHGLKLSRELGFSEIYLETADVLESAVAMYRAYGFEPYNPPHMAPRCDQAFIKYLVREDLR